MDQEQFEAACRRVRAGREDGGGIGTLGEKTLHAVLKHYCEPDESCHEQKVGSLVADIYNGTDIMEIQTRSFEKLWKKLPRLLEAGPVTVVYPIPATKWLIWVDPDTGECTPKRKSPKRGSPVDIYYELYKIRAFLPRQDLQLRLVFLDMEEYRLQNGWGNGGKRGSTRQERVPLALREEVWLSGRHGWDALLPDNLPEAFTSRDYAKAAHTRLPNAQRGLNILRGVGAIEQDGKQGRLLLYRRAPADQKKVGEEV